MINVYIYFWYSAFCTDSHDTWVGDINQDTSFDNPHKGLDRNKFKMDLEGILPI